jgi:large conductance mechanosensitive channel
MGWIKEFSDFMGEYKVIGLAIALIISLASTALVNSLVNNLVMLLVTSFIRDCRSRETV